MNEKEKKREKKKLASIFSPPPVLITERLLLRELRPSDASDMFEYASRPDVVRFLPWRAHPDIGYTRRWLEFIRGRYRDGSFYDWAVIKKSSDDGIPKMIGTCGFTAIDLFNMTGEIGYVINPVYRGRGYAVEAAGAVLEFAFGKLALNRVEAKYVIGNDASRRVMDKLGMSFEGVLRGSVYLKDRYCDIGICSILSSEYRDGIYFKEGSRPDRPRYS